MKPKRSDPAEKSGGKQVFVDADENIQAIFEHMRISVRVFKDMAMQMSASFSIPTPSKPSSDSGLPSQAVQ